MLQAVMMLLVRSEVMMMLRSEVMLRQRLVSEWSWLSNVTQWVAISPEPRPVQSLGWLHLSISAGYTMTRTTHTHTQLMHDITSYYHAASTNQQSDETIWTTLISMWISLSVRCDNHALNIAIYMLQLKRRRCLITEYILKNDEVISLWWCWTCSSPQRRWETIKNRFVLFVVASLRSGKKQCLLSQSSSASPLSSPWSSPTPTPRDSTTTCWATTTDWSDPWPTTRTRSLSRWGSNYLSWWTWWAWRCFIVSFIVLG